MPVYDGRKKRKEAPFQRAGATKPKKLASNKASDGERDHTMASTTELTDLSKLARKFVAGLAARLAGDDFDSAEGAFRAAISALPQGKLKKELARNEASTLLVLSAAIGDIRAASVASSRCITDHSGELETIEVGSKDGRDKRRRKLMANDVEVARDAHASRTPPVPLVACTSRLYSRVRRNAQKLAASSSEPSLSRNGRRDIRALALNPRAPFDLLVDAMGGAGITRVQGGAGSCTSTTSKLPLDGLKALTSALAVDPHSALSTSGLAFYIDRAAVLAAIVSSSALLRQTPAVQGEEMIAPEGIDELRLIFRILQVASFAVELPSDRSYTDQNSPYTSFASPTSPQSSLGESTPFAGIANQQLLLRCIPATTRKAAGSDGKGEDVEVPGAEISIACLLAHYAVALAAQCANSERKCGARELIRSVSMASGGVECGDSDGESSDDEGSDDEDNGGQLSCGGRESVLSCHLLTLCSTHLAGDEVATLEFLRCIGNTLYPKGKGSSHPSLVQSVADSLAPTCALALSRLRRPGASPAPSATRFLARAYAFRLVKSLISGDVLEATASCGMSVTKAKRRSTHSLGCTTWSTGRGHSWDFVGDAPVPTSLLEFLRSSSEVSEALESMGRSGVTAYLRLTSSCRTGSDLASLLRDHPACSPTVIQVLLEAAENLTQGMIREDATQDRAHQSNSKTETVDGFFVDTARDTKVEGGFKDRVSLVPLAVGAGNDVGVDLDSDAMSVDGAGEEDSEDDN